MKRKSLLVLMIMMAVVFTVTSVYAASFHDKIASQQKRIDRGIISGQLTRHEADTLQGNLNYIRETYHRMKSDGLLTPREAHRLERMLDENSRMIYNKKHNVPRRLY